LLCPRINVNVGACVSGWSFSFYYDSFDDERQHALRVIVGTLGSLRPLDHGLELTIAPSRVPRVLSRGEPEPRHRSAVTMTWREPSAFAASLTPAEREAVRAKKIEHCVELSAWSAGSSALDGDTIALLSERIATTLGGWVVVNRPDRLPANVTPVEVVCQDLASFFGPDPDPAYVAANAEHVPVSRFWAVDVRRYPRGWARR
jgi:hypothetical protein